MKKRKRHFVVYALVLTMLSSVISFGHVKTDKNEAPAFYDVETVEIVAQYFIDAQICDSDSEDGFSLGALPVLEETMYDFQNVPSAYNFSVYSEDGSYEGYIILGAQSQYAPVIEYGFSETVVTKEGRVRSLYENGRVTSMYYIGGTGYIAEVETEGGEVCLVNAETGVQIDNEGVENESNQPLAVSNLINSEAMSYEKDWDFLLAEGVSVNSVDPPITDPKADASPYKYKEGYNIPGCGSSSNYYKMEYFWPTITTVDENGNTVTSKQEVANCGPTAAVNFFKCYYNVFDYDYGMGWKAVYNAIVANVNLNVSSGVLFNDLATAVNTFWLQSSYNNTSGVKKSWSSTTAKGAWIANTLENKSPLIVLVQNHGRYGDHFLMSYGYKRFELNGDQKYYIRVADGWDSANRYLLVSEKIYGVIY